MQAAKANALIDILREALYRVEEDSKFNANDPAVLELKNSIARGIDELQLVSAGYDCSRAA